MHASSPSPSRVSDDAALAKVAERPSCASLVLGFASRGERLASARKAPVAGRIDRILDEARSLSRPGGMRTQSVVAALILAAAFVIGACRMAAPVFAQTRQPTTHESAKVVH